MTESPVVREKQNAAFASAQNFKRSGPSPCHGKQESQNPAAIPWLAGERESMKTRSDVAVEKFLSGYNCAQAVLYAFCDELHFDKDTALRSACGFGAGMGRAQDVCGAIAGGIIAIGLKHGRGEGQDKASTEETYLKVRELMARFESKHGTCNCRTLLKGCDLNTPEGRQHFKENDLLNKTCKGCVQTVVEALEEII